MKKCIYLLFAMLLILNVSACHSPNQTYDGLEITNHNTVSDSSDSIKEPQPTEEVKEDMGGTNMCSVHDEDYHAISSSLIEYVGEEEVYDWYNLVSIRDENSDCPYPNGNIYDFIHYFNIPKQDLEEIYCKDDTIYSNIIWDFDLLYSDNKNAVDAYYRDVEKIKEITDKRAAFKSLKFKIYVDHEDEWEETFGDARTRMEVSLGEIVSALNITRSELENYAEESVDPGCESYDYNYDAIYNADGSIRGTEVTLFSADPEPALAADAAFCGIDDFYLE